MERKNKRVYEFGSFQLEAEERLLRRVGKVIPLTPKAFDLLLIMVEQAGHLLEKEELLQAVWPDHFVEEHNLTDNISRLRKVLGEGENGQKFIETVPRCGYRFVMEVQEVREKFPALGKAFNDPNLPTTTNPELPTGVKSMEIAIASLPIAPPTPPVTVIVAEEQHHLLPYLLMKAMKALKKRIWKASLLLIGLAVLGSGIWWMLYRVAQKNTLSSALLTTPPATVASQNESQPIKSIAILPFKQLTPRKEDEYLGLGIADTLINRLSAQRQIQVRPLNATLADKDSDALAAGRAQKVDAVLEGTVQHVGYRLRVNVRLLSLPDGISLWTEKYDFTWQDFFSMQDVIAKQIVSALALQLSTKEQTALAKPLTSNAEALQLYLKGRYLYNRFDPSQYNSVLTLFQQAIAKDPEFAWAYAGIADAYIRIGWKGNTTPKTAWAQARAAAQKSLVIDPQFAAAYAILGATEFDSLKAEQFCLRALELDPNSHQAQVAYSLALLMQGRFSAAEAAAQRALALNPPSLSTFYLEAAIFFYSGQFERAGESARRMIAIEPNNPMPHLLLGEVLIQLGKYQEAIAEFKLMDMGENDDQIAAALALAGQREDAQQTLNHLKAIAQKRYVSSFSLARVCLALDDKEQSVAYLQKADEEQVGEMRFIKVDPRFVGLHNDPRFQEILRHRNLHD